MYADDTMLYYASKDYSDVENKINEDLENVKSGLISIS